MIVDEQKIPIGNQVQIDSLAMSEQTAKSVWVPNRNGIFLNIAAGFAEALECDVIVPGFNLEEAATFPDNTAAFLNASTAAFQFSTSNHVQANCFTTDKNKSEIAQLGKELQLPFELIWPCYQNLDHWCGECESCQRSRRALLAVGINFDMYAINGRS